MPSFTVTITRTVVTSISVEAANAAEARRQVDDYGLDLATQDYPAQQEHQDFRIKSVKSKA